VYTGLQNEQGQGGENDADTQSDVEDLLPPLASRAGMRSIEDEERDLLATIGATKERDRNMEREVPQTSSPSALSSGIPHSSSSSAFSSTSTSPSNSMSSSTLSNSPTTSWIPLRWRRLSDMEWVKKNGWSDQSGNVIIWGAPNVDNIGRMGDRADIKGKRGL
jgi:cytochrome c oxidase assembly factor 3